MDEVKGADFALRIALQTMKERCQQLHKRLNIVEEENVALKMKYSHLNPVDGSLNEIDTLRRKVTELTEEQSFLRQGALMLTNENKKLWKRLSKTTEDMHVLGTQLNKMKSAPLVRSKTFTQNEPTMKHLQTTLVENEEISLELEDISLKLLNSYSKEKNELELQCSEMLKLQSNEISINSFGFNYMDDDIDDSLSNDLEQHLNDLKQLKNSLRYNKDILTKNCAALQTFKVEPCNKCLELENHEAEPEENHTGEDLEEKMQFESLQQWGSMHELLHKRNHQICPMCSRDYSTEENFEVFLTHVEAHFKLPQN